MADGKNLYEILLERGEWNNFWKRIKPIPGGSCCADGGFKIEEEAIKIVAYNVPHIFNSQDAWPIHQRDLSSEAVNILARVNKVDFRVSFFEFKEILRECRYEYARIRNEANFW